jgi:hypothetical protein
MVLPMLNDAVWILEVFKHIWNTSTKLKLSHPQTVLAPSIFKLDSHNSCLRITGK